MPGANTALAASNSGLLVVERAWKQYIGGDSLDVRSLRPEVASSWQRCHNLRIDPYDQEPCELIIPALLRERRFYNQRLLRIARPAMENLYKFVKGTGFQVVLTDETGFLLDVLGDEDIVRRSEAVQLCPGGDWSEKAKGTNAIGTAIYERKPIQILASEHFCQSNHFLVCSAAPIFDPDGQMIGVLDLSGDCHYATTHTLGMVVAAVNSIENQLQLQRTTEKLYLEHRYSSALLDSMSDGMISVDHQGLIVDINPRGAEIFGVDRKQVRGRHVSQVLQTEVPILKLLKDGSAYEEKEILLNHAGKKLCSSASLVRDDSGFVLGAVAVFNEVSARQAPPRRRLELASSYCFDDIIGDSDSTVAMKRWAEKAAASPCTVLVTGESGTGKELFAHAIHSASSRARAPFIAINCAALPETLIESELFGFEEGSFTGARKGGQAGKFEMADGGTLFLDEISEMPLQVQSKLLRVLQEKKVARIGVAAERAVDVRIIAATNKDLAAEVAAGRFREDLYYRLAVLEVRIPALREHATDIPALTHHLAGRIAEKLKVRPNPIQPGFVEKLETHSWPGNVRELENAIERAMIEAGEDTALTADLLRFGKGTKPLRAAAAETARIRSLQAAEEDEVRRALVHCQGNILQASKLLGICRNTLYRKMKKYGIEL